MKLFEEIKYRDKGSLHNIYASIIDDFKDYDRITKVQMIKEIYKVYETEDFSSLFTTRELKYLSLYKDNVLPDDKKYDWEIGKLLGKYIICYENGNLTLYEESKDLVMNMLKNINWKTSEQRDSINEALIGYLKISCNALLISIRSIFPTLLNISEETLDNHMKNNLNFKFNTYRYFTEIPSLKGDVEAVLYNPYYEIYENVDEARKEKAVHGTLPSLETMKTVFYNDFDINNKKVKAFLDELHNIFPLEIIAYPRIAYSVMINDKEHFISFINSREFIKDDKTKLFELWESAFEEMPSACLNCMTPKENEKYLEKKVGKTIYQEKEYKPQVNANLSTKDVDLFYKLHFAVLEYTNRKYKIKPGLKIYKCRSINQQDLVEICEKFYENKEAIILTFCRENPFKLSNKELSLIKEFKKSVRDHFLLVKFEEEYTALLSDNCVYMVKGLTSNIDELISYKELPVFLITTLFPFKGQIVVDGIFGSYGIDIGPNVSEKVLEDYERLEKVYELWRKK